MQNKIQQRLLLWFLPKLLQNKSPDSIPRSGEEGAKMNCFSIYVEKDSNPLYLLDAFSKETDRFSVREWNKTSSSFSIEKNITSIDILSNDLRITHFYGLTDITFTGLYDLAFHYITKAVYVKIHYQRVINFIFQNAYNRRKLDSKNRINILSFLVKEQFEPRAKSNQHWFDHYDSSLRGFGAWELMTKIHSTRWHYHPLGRYELSKLGLYLDSLVMSGDLKKEGIQYKITGKALETIDEYDENERRHKDSIKIQRRISLLTFVIAIVAVASLFIQGKIDFGGTIGGTIIFNMQDILNISNK